MRGAGDSGAGDDDGEGAGGRVVQARGALITERALETVPTSQRRRGPWRWTYRFVGGGAGDTTARVQETMQVLEPLQA